MKLKDIKRNLFVIPMSFTLCFSALGITSYAVGNETSTGEVRDHKNLTGLKNVDGKWYYVNEDGTLKETGWLSNDNIDNIINDTEAENNLDTDKEVVEEKKTGWQNINGKLYYYLEDGSQYKETGWFEENDVNHKIDDGKEYYFENDYSAAVGWKEIGGYWYYFGEDGALKKGWILDNYNWYYADRTGEMQKGWIKVDGKKYYLNESGAMVIGKKYIDDKWMFFGNDGALQTGFYIYNATKYYSNKEGEMVSNKWITVNDKEYYIKADSSVAVGDMILNGQLLSFDDNGRFKGKSKNEIEDYLYIKYLNVGDADCAFIKLPSGETALIDTGYEKTSDKLIKFLNDQQLFEDDGKKVIDYVIITHGHSDHIGGLTSVLENFKVKKVFMNEKSAMKDWFTGVKVTKENAASIEMLKEDYRVYQNAMKYMDKHNIETVEAISGQTIDKNGILKFVQSDKEFGPIGSDKLLEEYWALNDRSLIVYLDYADLQVLFTGDIEWTAEKDFMVNKLLNEKPVDILKVPHHGHDTSSTVDFLRYVNSKLGVISRSKESIEKNTAYNNLIQEGVTIYETSEKDGISVYATEKNWNLEN